MVVEGLRDESSPAAGEEVGRQGLRHVPAGQTLPPTTVHGVSVSIPDLASLIGFESNDPSTLRRIPRGYPRFRLHPYAERVTQLMARNRTGSIGGAAGTEEEGDELVPTRSERAARATAAYAGMGQAVVEDEALGVWAVAAPRQSQALRRARDFVQHTGSYLPSRQAEQVLLAQGVLTRSQAESIHLDRPEERVVETIAEAYGLPDGGGVSLHNSGMNAIHSAITALDEVQRDRGRRRWLQLGWIFFDTVKLFEKGIVDAEHQMLPDPFDIDSVARAVAEQPSTLAGIIAEVPSNPLMQTPDVQALREIADQAGGAVVLDATIGTPHNVDVVDHADVVCESLTKYAMGSADLLMGAAIVNPRSSFAEHLRVAVSANSEAPCHRDAARAAHRIGGYRDRMRCVNANAMALADFFASQKAVRKVHWAYETESAGNYERVARSPDSPGGLLLLDLRIPVEQIYDRVAVPKGPSFGAAFTMAAPQIFIAHFDLLSTPEGRKTLRSHGLHRDMLRISVGTEPYDDIAGVFAEAFERAGR